MKISCQSCGAKYNIADEKVRGKIVKIACKKCGARIEIDGREPADQAQDHDETRVFDQAQAPGAAPAGGDSWTVSIDDNDQREVSSAQLVDLYRQGVVTADTFVWRDGMADWQAVRDVAALQGQLGSGAPVAISAPPPAAPMPSEPPTAIHPAMQDHAVSGGGYNGGGASVPMAAAGGYGSPQIDTAQPARLGGSRRGGGVDLFGQQQHPSSEDDDVATSAPSGAALGAMAAAPVGDGKPLGSRNENSVLFSLSALTASGPATAAAPAHGPEDEKSGLIDIQKLAAAAKPNGNKDDRAKLDDIMNLGGGGAFGSALGAPILAPPPAAALSEGPAAYAGGEETKKSNKGLFIGLGVMGVVIIALLLVLVLKKGGGEDASKDKDKAALETPKSDDKGKAPAAASETVAAAPTTTAPPDQAPTGDQGGPIGKAGPGGKAPPGGAAAPGAKPGAADTAAKPDKPAPEAAAPGGAKKPCKSLEECMGGATPPPAAKKDDAPAAGGGGEIDKAAAVSALKGVPYKDCGSGGAGKVQVTFGPNGNVTSAVVSSGDYDGGTKSCIQSRFRSAKVPAYGGAPKTFGWSISL